MDVLINKMIMPSHNLKLLQLLKLKLRSLPKVNSALEEEMVEKVMAAEKEMVVERATETAVMTVVVLMRLLLRNHGMTVMLVMMTVDLEIALVMTMIAKVL